MSENPHNEILFSVKLLYYIILLLAEHLCHYQDEVDICIELACVCVYFQITTIARLIGS